MNCLKMSKVCAVIIILMAGITSVQAFDCGSNGSDGALTFTNPTSPTTILFDPTDTSLVGRQLDTDNDRVYHFTSINIPSNLTLKFTAPKAGYLPFIWLSQGNVVIDGALDLNGDKGHQASDSILGQPSNPGSGGFPGGWGQSSVLGISSHIGFGPSENGGPGNFSGNLFLMPLIGGNGGSGGYFSPAGGGGGGGGAILIASNTSININGSISANGGDGGDDSAGQTNPYYAGYGGAGGGIRFLAPVFSGNGSISAKVGNGSTQSNPLSAVNDGVIRIESNTDSYTGTFIISSQKYRRVTLVPSAVNIFPQVSNINARVVRIGGVELPTNPRGIFVVPDVVLNTSNPVLFEIEAHNVPLGTKFKIFLWNETERAIEFESLALIGTLESSTATASNVVPNGLTRGFIYANWTP